MEKEKCMYGSTAFGVIFEAYPPLTLKTFPKGAVHFVCVRSSSSESANKRICTGIILGGRTSKKRNAIYWIPLTTVYINTEHIGRKL